MPYINIYPNIYPILSELAGENSAPTPQYDKQNPNIFKVAEDRALKAKQVGGVPGKKGGLDVGGHPQPESVQRQCGEEVWDWP